VNLKLRGRNQQIQPAQLGILGEGKTMVVGVDVTHPSPGSSKRAPSVVGIVGSIDRFCAQFPGDIRIQESKKEMVSALTELVKGRLELWRKTNKTLPGE
jgi:eukaryotic translation initiation factor 2C